MPREKRKISDNGIYYIFACGELTKKLSPSKDDKACLIDIFFDLKHNFDFEIFAYSVTNNEFHTVVRETHPLEISEIMRLLFSRYTSFYNAKYETSGKLLHDRFRSTPLDSVEDLKITMRYVHQVPVKLLEHPNVFSYSFSSYNEYFTPSLVDTAYPLSLFSANEKEGRTKFKIFHAFIELSNPKGELRPQYTFEELEKVVKGLTNMNLADVFALPRDKRLNLAKLLKKKTPLSLRQIERATKISRATVAKL